MCFRTLNKLEKILLSLCTRSISCVSKAVSPDIYILECEVDDIFYNEINEILM